MKGRTNEVCRCQSRSPNPNKNRRRRVEVGEEILNEAANEKSFSRWNLAHENLE